MDSVSSVTSINQSFGPIDDPAFLLYKEFVKENHVPDLIRILLQSETAVHYSVLTDCSSLLKHNVDFAEELFCQSELVLQSFGLALRAISKEIYNSHPLKHQMKLKPYLHARLKKFPKCDELWRHRIPKSKDIGQFLAVVGTVIRTSSVKLLEYQKELMCTKCKNVFTVKSEFSQNYRIVTPHRCPSGTCNCKKFMIISATSGGGVSTSKCKDFQEVRIQEQIRQLAMGTIPRTITVVLEDDLVDSCKAGDDVVIYGTLLCRWRPVQAGKPCDLEIVIKANYVEVRNEQQLGENIREEMQNEFDCFWVSYDGNRMTARNHILASLCPQIYGLYVVKLAVALVLAGGVPKTDATGSRVRGEAHLLMVGDPGTGKSQFLKYATKITPRSVLTTGIGSTTAGLTVTAVRDGPHWTLEAGALVLADGGLCCIDEFSSIKEHDRCAIHEAMEQQTVSVAKAGLVCKLNTRTSVLAATNPKLGKYDESNDLSMNLAIGSPLLSRFDIILVLLDSKNERWDSVVADYLLMGKDAVQEMRGGNEGKPKLWTLEQMQAYFCLIHQLKPVLTSQANQILSAYYRCHRRSNVRNAARTTIRLLESLIRLAEGHARLMYRQTVEIQDAVAAITIMESSMHGSSLLPTGSVLHSCFPVDAEKEYLKHERLVLQCLGLEELISKGNEPKPADTSQLNDCRIPDIKTERMSTQGSCSNTPVKPIFPQIQQQTHAKFILKETNQVNNGTSLQNGNRNIFNMPETPSEFRSKFSAKKHKPEVKRTQRSSAKSMFQIPDEDFNLDMDLGIKVETVSPDRMNIFPQAAHPLRTPPVIPDQVSPSQKLRDTAATKQFINSAKKQPRSFLKRNIATSTQKDDVPVMDVGLINEFDDSWADDDVLDDDELKRIEEDENISYSPTTSPKNVEVIKMQKEFQNCEEDTLNPSLIEDICADIGRKENKSTKSKSENKGPKSIFNIDLPPDSEVFFPSQLSFISQAIKRVSPLQNHSTNFLSSKHTIAAQNKSLFRIDNSDCDLDVSLNLSNFDIDFDPTNMSPGAKKSKH